MRLTKLSGCAFLRETANILKAYKYGGTSLATSEKIRNHLQYAFKDQAAVSIVLSAPAGVTNLAYDLADPTKREESMREIECIFYAIVDGLRELPEAHKLEVLEGLCEMRRLAYEFQPGDSIDYLATRGEVLITIIAEGLSGGEWERVDPTKFIRLTKKGGIDLYATKRAFAAYDDFPKKSLVPGFLGLDRAGNVRALGRNGTDSTVMVVALLLKLKLVRKGTEYEGILATDPGFVNDPDTIDLLGHAQLISMAERSRSFLQTSAMEYARKGDITLEVFSASKVDTITDPGAPLTRIYPDGHKNLARMREVVSVVGKSGFTMFSIDKVGMDDMDGFSERVLMLLRREFRTGYIYSTTGEENVDFVVPTAKIAGRESEIANRIRQKFRVDSIHYQAVAIVSVIGKDLGKNPNMVGRIYCCLDTARWRKTNMLFHEQSFKGSSIVIGVEESRLRPTIEAIYDMVVKR